jgi:hypothetical protein
MSRSSRRSHSHVTPPSGEATSRLRTLVRCLVANDPPRTIRSTPAACRACSTKRQSTWNQHPRVTDPVPDAQHAKPPRRCSCPAHYTDVTARQGKRRLAAAVTLCSGAQEHGRPNASLLATSRSPRRSKNLKAESQLQPVNKRRRGRTNQYGPTIDRRLRSSGEPHERNLAHRQR